MAGIALAGGRRPASPRTTAEGDAAMGSEAGCSSILYSLAYPVNGFPSLSPVVPYALPALGRQEDSPSYAPFPVLSLTAVVVEQPQQRSGTSHRMG